MASEGLNHTVTVFSLLLSLSSFGLFSWKTVQMIKEPDHPIVKDASDKIAGFAPSVSAKEVGDAIGNLAKLAEALSKAGPALTSLIAAIFFMLIAAVTTVGPLMKSDDGQARDTTAGSGSTANGAPKR